MAVLHPVMHRALREVGNQQTTDVLYSERLSG